MSPAKVVLEQIIAEHSYQVPLMVIIILVTVGLGIKSGLYPFHTWIPDAYGYTTYHQPSAILSSLVSKGYIFLLIKIFYRVLGFDSIISSHMVNILFAFGVIGMIMGSVAAIKERNIRRMTAYSSVAQIGYIYMGLGLGTTAGVVAAVFHIISHGVMKSLLFLSISGLTEVSDGRSDYLSLRGAGLRNKIAGVAFTVGSLSMIGMPLLTGFISKYLFASAATTAGNKMITAWMVLAVSTVLNTMYFMRTVLTLYRPVSAEVKAYTVEKSRIETAAIIGMILLNIGLGVASQPVIKVIEAGLAMFG